MVTQEQGKSRHTLIQFLSEQEILNTDRRIIVEIQIGLDTISPTTGEAFTYYVPYQMEFSYNDFKWIPYQGIQRQVD